MDGYETVKLLRQILDEMKKIREQIEDMNTSQVELVATAHSIQAYGTQQHR
jgi:hypothetical protein